MSDFTKFKQTLMSAPTSFAADGMVCPRCGEDTLGSDDWPDEAYMDDEFRRAEYFTCHNCDLHVAVMDDYVLDPSKRQVRISENPEDVFFDIQSQNP